MLHKKIFSNSIIDYEVLYDTPFLSEPYHIVFGVNQKFIRATGVCIFSILRNNPQSSFHFHIIGEGIQHKDRLRLCELAQKWGATVYLYYAPTSLLKEFPDAGHLSTATYYRLLAPEILKDLAKRLLYLDSDIVCLREITEIGTISLKNKIAAAVMENNQNIIESFHLKQKHYFNAGVLLIDIEKWNQYDVFSKAFVVLNENTSLITTYDQDALNVVLNEQIQLIDSKWNQRYAATTTKHTIPADTIFLHYLGLIKPWHADYRHPLGKYFFEYQKDSSWAKEPLESPTLFRSRKKAYYKLLVKEKRYFKALFWYVSYHITQRG